MRHAQTFGAALLLAALIAGCGSASKPAQQRTTSVSGSRSATTTASRAAITAVPTPASTSGPGSVPSAALAFARCMRANGVTGFPDPTPGNGLGFEISSGTTSSPAFHTAVARCQKLLPIAAPGGGAPASRQTITKLLRIARCMRAHGVHQFPDPYYTRPADITPGRYSVITDFDGAFLLFPRTMNLQAPAYRRALTACGAPPLGLPH
ncbi:MAG TPA: hypothetical protein VHU61_00645 [Solirubrobacteraceae bacterium]|nr:hypothetical protein [Solirubrobacteraceae bacterium]